MKFYIKAKGIKVLWLLPVIQNEEHHLFYFKRDHCNSK